VQSSPVKKIVLFLLTIALFLLVRGGNIVLAGPAQIELYSEAEISSAVITLGDIANINPGEFSEENLAEIELGSAPRPGNSKELTAQIVDLYVRNSALSRSDFNLSGAETVEVITGSQEIAEDEIVAQLIEVLEDEANTDTALEDIDYNLHLDLTSEAEKLKMPAGEFSLSPLDLDPEKVGRSSWPVELEVEGETWRRLNLSAVLTYELPVYVLTTDVERGEEITEDILEQEKKKVEIYPEDLILNLEKDLVLHGESRRSYSEGTVLQRDMLELPDVVTRGDEITVQASSGGVEINILAIARERGTIGEVIELENPDSGNYFRAEIISPDLARAL